MLQTRILVVDDEIAVRDMLECGLSKAGFAVRGVGDGGSALDATREWGPKLIILDVMLPEIDGFAILPALRSMTDVPIIMLSAKNETTDKITGLSRGADDYVAKPFDLEELIARIQSALRRPRLEVRHTLTYGDLTVDVVRRLAFRGERKVELSKRELDLLVILMKQPGQVFTRSQLLDLVWGVDSEVVPNVVETYISYLRSKIDNNESVKRIRTVRGAGYMFNPDES